MKHIGEHLGEIDDTGPGRLGEGVRPGAGEHFIIVPIDDNFDIDAVFQAEPQPVEAAPEPAVESVVLVNPEPISDDSPKAPLPPVVDAVTPTPVAENLIRFNPESLAPDRTKAPSLSVADLLENHVRLEWHEAVAIAQHLCHVMARDPAANLHRSLVEPWNVEITNDGEVQVLPGGSSSDPLVKQVGRVLRALLQDAIAPAELRLVASQASFDVPVYASVDDLSAALRHFERPGDSGAIRAAFNRGLEAKRSGFQTPARVAPAVRPQAVDQREAPNVVPPSRPPARRRSPSRKMPIRLVAAGAAAAMIAVATMFAISRLVRVPVLEPVPGERTASVVEPSARPVAPQPSPAPESRTIEPEQGPAPVTPPVSRPAVNAAAPAVSRRVPKPLTGSPGVSRRATPEPRRTAPAEPAAATGDSIDPNEHQAAGLLASGRADEAAMFFDAIVLRNPFYQPDPAHTSPEALSALRNSKRTILPAMARRYYQDARAAFDAGDFSLAITQGERAQALLNDLGIGAESADVNGDVSNLLALASGARTLEEEKIYSAADAGVTPPRPLGRQLSAASMSRISLRPTGRLEILVGRSGRVEAVKLDTPLNGYHDRMLVSAAKAWHYKPAIRNGKAVRFSLVLTIRLPDL